MNVSERNFGYAMALSYAPVMLWAWFFHHSPEWELLFVSWVFYLLMVAMEVRYRVLLSLGLACGFGLAACVSALVTGKELATVIGLGLMAIVGYLFLIRVIQNTTFKIAGVEYRGSS